MRPAIAGSRGAGGSWSSDRDAGDRGIDSEGYGDSAAHVVGVNVISTGDADIHPIVVGNDGIAPVAEHGEAMRGGIGHVQHIGRSQRQSMTAGTEIDLLNIADRRVGRS